MRRFAKFVITALLAPFSVFASDNEDVVRPREVGVALVAPAVSDGRCRLEAPDMKDRIPVRIEGKIVSLFPRDAQAITNADAGSLLTHLFTFGATTMEKSLSLKIDGAKAAIRTSEKMPEFLDLVIPPETPPERMLSLVRLMVKDQFRVVQVARLSSSRFTGHAESPRDFGGNAQIPLVAEKVVEKCLWRGREWTHYKVRPAIPLEKGEYGFLIYRVVYDFSVD